MIEAEIKIIKDTNQSLTEKQKRIIELVHKIRKRYLEKTKFETSYGYKGNAVPDEIVKQMHDQLRVMLMVLGIEKRYERKKS